MSQAEMGEAIRHFLPGIGPATGFLDPPDEHLRVLAPAPRHTTYPKLLTV